MPHEPTASLDDVSEAFHQVLRNVTVARDAWVSGGRDDYDLWLLVDPVDMAEERELYSLVDPLLQNFGSTGFSLHVLNPQTFVDLKPGTIVPSQARHIHLQTPR